MAFDDDADEGGTRRKAVAGLEHYRDTIPVGNVASSIAIETGKKADSVAKSLRDRAEGRASKPKRDR